MKLSAIYLCAFTHHVKMRFRFDVDAVDVVVDVEVDTDQMFHSTN